MNTMNRRNFLAAAAGWAPLLGVKKSTGEEDIRSLLARAFSSGVEEPEGCWEPMRVALVVGHNSQDKGARGADPLKGNEWDYWMEHSGALVEAFHKFGCESKVFLREKTSSHREEIQKCYSCLESEFQPHGIIELHYNEAGRRAPEGTITLHGGKIKAAVLAEACQSAMERILSKSGVDRRTLPWSRIETRKNGRGCASLSVSSTPTVILEPAFSASNPLEAEILKTFGEEMCWAIAKNVSEAKLPLTAQGHE